MNRQENARGKIKEMLQMVEDMIATKRAKGEKVPPHLIKKRNELKAELECDPAEGGYLYALEVFGHPQVTTIRPDTYGNLVPIKVRADSNSLGVIERYIERAQALVDVLQEKLGRTGDLTLEEEVVLELLRKETMPELNRLSKILSQKQEYLSYGEKELFQYRAQR